MSVVIETTKGDITVDLYLKERPRACLNFLKLCKIKYYNFNLFHTITRNFITQTGDPTGSRTGGESIFGVLEGPTKRYVEAETNPRIKHTKMGLISFVCNEDRMMASQFFFTLGDELTYLDEKHCVFGEVVEGFDVLEEVNEAICCNEERPYQDIRITHTVVLDDPLPDPSGLRVPSRSPSPSAERLQNGRIPADEEIDETTGKSAIEVNEVIAQREAVARATILEMVGDIPDADMAPPENVLFVCKLNPVTTDDDLEIIFSRFGKIKSCEVIRDHKTSDSLQYAFIEFEEKKSCEDAYFKMDNVLIDDRRIHVDFSQSLSKIKWRGKGRGVTYYDDRGNKTDKPSGDFKSKQRPNKDGNKRYENDKEYRNKKTDRDEDNKDEKMRRYHDEIKNESRGRTYGRVNEVKEEQWKSGRSDKEYRDRRERMDRNDRDYAKTFRNRSQNENVDKVQSKSKDIYRNTKHEENSNGKRYHGEIKEAKRDKRSASVDSRSRARKRSKRRERSSSVSSEASSEDDERKTKKHDDKKQTIEEAKHRKHYKTHNVVSDKTESRRKTFENSRKKRRNSSSSSTSSSDSDDSTSSERKKKRYHSNSESDSEIKKSKKAKYESHKDDREHRIKRDGKYEKINKYQKDRINAREDGKYKNYQRKESENDRHKNYRRTDKSKKESSDDEKQYKRSSRKHAEDLDNNSDKRNKYRQYKEDKESYSDRKSKKRAKHSKRDSSSSESESEREYKKQKEKKKSDSQRESKKRSNRRYESGSESDNKRKYKEPYESKAAVSKNKSKKRRRGSYSS